jgi:hypothetical protein
VSEKSVYLSIGAINFKVSGPQTSLNQPYDPSYKNFISPGSSKKNSVSVRLLPDADMPDLTTLSKIFDTPHSWSMYSNSDSRYIAFHPLGNNAAPKWITRINANLRNIDVFCDKSINPIRYPLDQLLLINLLVGQGLLIHAAGMRIDDRGYIFAGPSGAGKSTICELFKNTKNCTFLSDDRIVICKTGQDIFMYGTPWPGDAGVAVNEYARLHGIFFLKQSNENCINELNGADTLNYLFKVASLPLYDDGDMEKSLHFCEDLLNHVKFYELNFNPDPEIVQEVVSFVTG